MRREAFGQSQAFFESSPSASSRALRRALRGRGAPARARGAAEAASRAVAPGAVAALAARVAAAYAATLRRDAAEPDEDAENDDDEAELGAWDTSVEAVAALCEAAETWEAPEEDEREKTLRRNALAGLAATAAAHVRAYWDAAAALEPPCAAMDDATEEAEEQEAPPAHPAAAPTLRFACETLVETVEEARRTRRPASAVWSAAGAWASHLPAWRARRRRRLDDDTLDALTAIVGAAVEAKAGETALAAIAVPAARAAAAALGETEDADARLAAGRAVAAAVAAYPPAATAEVVAAARVPSTPPWEGARRAMPCMFWRRSPRRAGGGGAGPRRLDAREGRRGVRGGLEPGGRGCRASRRARRRVRFDAARVDASRRGRAGQAPSRRDAHRGDAMRERARGGGGGGGGGRGRFRFRFRRRRRRRLRRRRRFRRRRRSPGERVRG